MPRALSRKIILPEGELRRFRLPEAMDDEELGAGPAGGVQRWPLLAGWAAFTALCFWLGRGDLALEEWLHRVGAPAAAAAVERAPAAAALILPAQQQKTTPPSPVALRSNRPAPLPAGALRPVLQPMTTQSIHGGGFVRSEAVSAGVGALPRDEFAEDLPSAQPFSDSDELPKADLARGTGASNESRPSDSDAEFQEDLSLAQAFRAPPAAMAARGPDPVPARTPARRFDPSPVRMKGLSFLGPQRRPVPSPSEPGPSRKAPDSAPVRVSSGGAGIAEVGGGCQSAFNSAKRNIAMSGSAVKDVPRERYSRLLENFSNFARCQVPEHVTLRICVAVQSGRALGVTVTTKPASSAARCVARVVQTLSFPSGENPDLVRTEFRSQ